MGKVIKLFALYGPDERETRCYRKGVAMEEMDVIVIGAGVVGLAIARSLGLSGREVFVVDSERFPASLTSARNSGVIHAGIYYSKGSNKARLCVSGKKLLYAYLKDKKIPHENCQKLIVANTDDDLQKLQAIKQKALDNGVDDLRVLSAREAVAMEPELNAIGALLSPSTGILDVHEYAQALIVDIESNGGFIALQNRVISANAIQDGLILRLSSGDSIKARAIINAAGIGAQSLAEKISGLPTSCIPAQHLAKGNYFTVSGSKPFERLIYPVPVAGGLGAHYTRNMVGESLFGPDVQWIERQEYDRINYDVDAARVGEFYSAIEKYWPGVRERQLRPAYSGVRPKLVGAGGQDADFMIQGPSEHGVSGLVNLYGIESPGLTASLAIAEEVTRLAN
jgi:L-2-hydroxyglutarate oxidase LhgO